MSKQLYVQLLASLKRSNRDRKLALAKKAGYSSVEEYKDYLEKQINDNQGTKKTTSLKSTSKVTIHVVDIIDCSGSMSGGKILNAVKGINKGVKELQESTEAEYTYTLCNFADAGDIKISHLKKPIVDIVPVEFRPRGCTALYDAIGTTINKVKQNLGKTDKVLVNIYTDGGENGSMKFRANQIAELIKSLEGIFTVTFIGTQMDVAMVTRNLSIHESNTLVYDGSAAGLDSAMTTNSVSRTAYAKGASAGEDVSKGFYKKLN